MGQYMCLRNLFLLLVPSFRQGGLRGSLGSDGFSVRRASSSMRGYSYVKDRITVSIIIQICMLKDLEKESIQVTIRVRPPSERELFQNSRACIELENSSQRLTFTNGNERRYYKFDSIVGTAEGQQQIFERVGLNSAIHCLEGYNCSIFAYGQTGSGKTFTMMGVGQEDPYAFEKRGLIPRTLEHLFECIEKETEQSRTEYLVKCTFLEIYNQQINDLLESNNRKLQLREDLKKGVYVQGISEHTIFQSREALDLLKRGSKGRHVGCTFYNEESSRSHSVFTLLLQSKLVKNGVINVKHRRFHFIDLAGSEKTNYLQKIYKNQNSDKRLLKQGCHINKSLHVLGVVINSLVEATEGKPRHVNYRDSKLTFLLKDALGGNSKTHLIANISPSAASSAQTLSTLKFAQNVKMIKLNKASINEDASGNLEALKCEILRLKQEIILLKSHQSAITKEIGSSNSQVQNQLQRVFLRSDGHLGLERQLKEYIEESIEKQTKFEVELLKRQEKIQKLHGAIKQYTRNEMHMRMIIELYEKRFLRLKGLETKINSMGESIEQEALVEFFGQERETLHVEVTQLRELLKETPFLKALIKENNILREESKNNPEELASAISANMKFLLDLKNELTSSIKEREELNGIIESYAMQKNTEMISPRKQQEIETEFNQKQIHYEQKIQQLELEVAVLNSTIEKNECDLKEFYQNVNQLKGMVEQLSEKAQKAEKVDELENEIKERAAKEEEFERKISSVTMQMIGLKEELNKKQSELAESKSSVSALQSQISQNKQTLQLLENEYEEKISSLQKQVKEQEQQGQQLNLLLQQAQKTLEMERVNQEKLVESKSSELSKLLERIDEIERSNNDYISTIEALKLQVEKEVSSAAKSTEEFNSKIEKMAKQLESERVQNKRREEELEVRWMNEKVSTEDEGKNKIKQLNLELIAKENKISANKESYEKQVQMLEEEAAALKSEIQELTTLTASKAKLIEEAKGKEEQLTSSLKSAREEFKKLVASSSAKQNELSISIHELQASVSSFQSKYRDSQSTVISLQEQACSLRQDLSRKQKQLQRLKESHAKQIQMIRQQNREYKGRVTAHELSMKQIFDECLGNKQKIIAELKLHHSNQLLEEKKQSDQKIIRLKEVETKLKQAEQELQAKQSIVDEKQRVIQNLQDQLEREVNQAIIRAEERQNAYSQFVERKNEEIQHLESTVKGLRQELIEEKNSLTMQKQELLQSIQALVDDSSNNDGNSQEGDIVAELKRRFAEYSRANSQLQRVNGQLSTQLGTSNLREAKQRQQLDRLQEKVLELQSELSRLNESQEELMSVKNQYQTKLNNTATSKQEIAIMLENAENRIGVLAEQLEVLKQEAIKKDRLVLDYTRKDQMLSLQYGEAEKELQNARKDISLYKQLIEEKESISQENQRELERMQSILSEVQRSKQQAYRSNDLTKSELQKTESELKQLNSYRERYLKKDSQLKQSLSENHELRRQIIQIQSASTAISNQNRRLQREMGQLRVEYTIQVRKTQQLSVRLETMSEMNKEKEDARCKNQLLIIRQEEYNQQLEGRFNSLSQENKELKASVEEYQVDIRTLVAEKKIIEEELDRQRHLAINKLQLMEQMELKIDEEKDKEIDRVKAEFMRELEEEKGRFNEERMYLSRINQEFAQNIENLNQANKRLAESNEEMKGRLRISDQELAKEMDRGIGLKRLIENLERQKQQLEKQLQEKETSYKRLLSKICKDDEPRKASEDKRLKTNELLEKSRLELLQYKKIVDEGSKQMKKLKAEMQSKEEHYLDMRQKAEENCRFQENAICQVRSNYNKLEHEHNLLLKEVQELYGLKDHIEALREEIAGYKAYKEKSERRREDLELTIKSLSDELEGAKRQLDGRGAPFSRGQDEKLIYINKLKEENNLLKNQKYTLSDETARLQKQNKLLKEKLNEQTQQKLRLKQERKTIKDCGQRDLSSGEIALKLELQNKTNEVRYLQQGYAAICRVLNIKSFSQAKNRGDSTLGLIKDVVQQLTEEVGVLRCALKQREKQIQNKNLKIEIISREYNHLKSKQYRRNSGNEFNPIKNALQQTNKIVGEEYNSFENIKNRALELKEQSKLRRDK